MSNTSTLQKNINSVPKDKSIRTDLQTILCYLRENVATASMTELATGVHHKSICRYKRDLEKAGLLWEVKKDICERTGFKAWYLTTNPERGQQWN